MMTMMMMIDLFNLQTNLLTPVTCSIDVLSRALVETFASSHVSPHELQLPRPFPTVLIYS